MRLARESLFYLLVLAVVAACYVVAAIGLLVGSLSSASEQQLSKARFLLKIKDGDRFRHTIQPFGGLS